MWVILRHLIIQCSVYGIFSDTYIQKAKKSYMDSRARRNLSHLNSELQDVQRIMVQNIDDVLQRGEQLSGIVLLNILLTWFLNNVLKLKIPQLYNLLHTGLTHRSLVVRAQIGQYCFY